MPILPPFVYGNSPSGNLNPAPQCVLPDGSLSCEPPQTIPSNSQSQFYGTPSITAGFFPFSAWSMNSAESPPLENDYTALPFSLPNLTGVSPANWEDYARAEIARLEAVEGPISNHRKIGIIDAMRQLAGLQPRSFSIPGTGPPNADQSGAESVFSNPFVQAADSFQDVFGTNLDLGIDLENIGPTIRLAGIAALVLGVGFLLLKRGS